MGKDICKVPIQIQVNIQVQEQQSPLQRVNLYINNSMLYTIKALQFYLHSKHNRRITKAILCNSICHINQHTVYRNRECTMECRVLHHKQPQWQQQQQHQVKDTHTWEPIQTFKLLHARVPPSRRNNEILDRRHK